MPSVTADLIVNHGLYAKSNVDALDSTFKNISQSFSPGEYIGNVYSWIQGNDGSIYWMIYLTPQDYNNFNPVYVKHIPGTLSVPDLPAILQKLDDERKAAEIAKNGVVSYYIGKYLPYIVAAAVVAIVFPSVVKGLKK
jgi:hypothetical protein